MCAHPPPPPLTQRINFLGWLHVLRLGASYDKAVQVHDKQDAAEAVLFGLIALHIGGSRLDAATLGGLSLGDWAEHFALPLHVERPQPDLPAVSVCEPSPVRVRAARAPLHTSSCCHLLH